MLIWKKKKKKKKGGMYIPTGAYLTPKRAAKQKDGLSNKWADPHRDNARVIVSGHDTHVNK